MDKKEIAQILYEIGTLLELRGDNTFKSDVFNTMTLKSVQKYFQII